ncbi:MAG: hypothetical protein EA360_03435 [Balneolaceae bacterium]|nr:MAG: hypothetical protein EA360_03435 [Balneolaceae bacterium]
MKKLPVFTLALSFISLMGFWIIMSGYLDFIHITMGIVTVSGVMFVNHKLKQHLFHEDDLADLSRFRFGSVILYPFWLLGQIIVAGFHVVGLIIKPSMPIHTTLITFRADLPSSHARVILGTSITLTPGTLTVDLEDDRFTVHALDDKSHEGITSDNMPRKVLSLFEAEERQVIHDLKIINLTQKQAEV